MEGGRMMVANKRQIDKGYTRQERGISTGRAKGGVEQRKVEG